MININNRLVIDIFINLLAINSVYKGTNLVFIKKPSNFPLGITKITIDQSNSPIVLTGYFGKDGTSKNNVITWLRENSHRYVGTYNTNQGMIIKQLDDSDSTKYADGTNALSDIQDPNKNVFMRIPSFWFKGTQSDTSNLDVWTMNFTLVDPEDESWTKWDENTLIGVYEASTYSIGVSKSVIKSLSKLRPSYGNTMASPNRQKLLENIPVSGDDVFNIINYKTHQVMALLYMAYYGNVDGLSLCGEGTSGRGNDPNTTGNSDSLGMTDTTLDSSNSLDVVNFWGLENWWGDLKEYIDGIDISEKGLLLDDRIIGLVSSGEIKKLVLGEKLDVFPKSTIYNSNYDTYYADLGLIGYGTLTSVKISYPRRSGESKDIKTGPFYFYATEIEGTDAASTSRLQYNGRVVEENPSTVLLSSIDIDPLTSVMSVSKARTVSQLTITGLNLSKLDTTITNLPEGISISQFSEGDTKRTASIISNITEDLECLEFNIGGFNVIITNPALHLE